MKGMNVFMKNDLTTLIHLLNNFDNSIENFKTVLNIIPKIDFLLPFNDNHLVELIAGNNTYIPLFTSKSQITDLNYTRLDTVKLEVVVRDIFKNPKFHAITINPFTHDFIITNNTINLINLKRMETK